MLAVDPGGLFDSRAFTQDDVPRMWWLLITIVGYIQPLLKRFNPEMNTSAGAATDVADLAAAEEFEGKEGHFQLRKEYDSSVESHDEATQGRLFAKSLEWCGIRQEDTVLSL